MSSTLYDNSGIKIVNSPDNPGEHHLHIGPHQYILQRGVLKHFAGAERGELEQMLQLSDSGILEDVRTSGLAIGSLCDAFTLAYRAEEVRMEREMEALKKLGIIK